MAWTPPFLAASHLFRRCVRPEGVRNLNRIAGTLTFGFGTGSQILLVLR
jgi:hypothetical protein